MRRLFARPNLYGASELLGAELNNSYALCREGGLHIMTRTLSAPSSWAGKKGGTSISAALWTEVEDAEVD